MPRGALAVPRGDEVVPVVNALGQSFANVVLTQDWHPPRHISFASSHPGRRPFDGIALPYGEQVLWPDHCVQATPGAALHAALDVPHARLVVRKGYHPAVDSCPAFVESDRSHSTGLAGYLRERGIRCVYLVGLATDFCVAWSALDGRQAGFDVIVVEDACRAIDTNGLLATAWETMRGAGVLRMSAAEILG
jgi:nicotinamidase/pyrazinamidase